MKHQYDLNMYLNRLNKVENEIVVTKKTMGNLCGKLDDLAAERLKSDKLLHLVAEKSTMK